MGIADGLLMGLGKAFESGVPAYQEAKKNSQLQALEERKRKQELAMKGYTEDEQGNLVETPEAKLDREAKRGLLESQSEYYRGKAKGQGEGGLTFNQQLAKERLTDQRTARKDKAVEGLAHRLGNSQEIASSIAAVEKQLGFSLDDWDAKSGKAAKKGVNGAVLQEVDLPGASVPLLGRVTAFSGDARQLESRVAKVFNTELRDRSGAAVTTPELERLKSEFAAGKFNTESEMIGALQEYKAAARSAMKNIELGAPPEALEEYRSRGGLVSESMNNGGLLQQAKSGMKRATKTPGLMQSANANDGLESLTDEQLALEYEKALRGK